MSLSSKDERLQLYKRSEVRRLLCWSLQGHRSIIPSPSNGDAPFPEVAKILRANMDIVLLLEEMASCGIYLRRRIYSKPACSNCGSINVSYKYVCPLCGGHDLDKGVRIEHHECGHVDFQTQFEKGRELICPKCGKELKLLGTDYHRLEGFILCNECKREFSIPKIVQTCLSCGVECSFEKADIKPIFGYILNENLNSEIISYCSIEPPIVEFLETHGYEVEAPGKLGGESGTDHLFDIVATQGERAIVFTLANGSSETDEDFAINLLGRFSDVHADRAVLVSTPRLSNTAKRLLEFYGIEHVEGETKEEIVERLSAVFGKSSKPTSIRGDSDSLGQREKRIEIERERLSDLLSRIDMSLSEESDREMTEPVVRKKSRRRKTASKTQDLEGVRRLGNVRELLRIMLSVIEETEPAVQDRTSSETTVLPPEDLQESDQRKLRYLRSIIKQILD
ncbi:MAG: hypothetical protein JSW01_04785 [Candidatus Bathyarchaeota archaeon]|nr:MAG: hypothetical protein JSW01_04785 [Candidatus Bathyarchaeota archaeon]